MLAEPPRPPHGADQAGWVLKQADRRAASSGVTLQYLCQGWSWEGAHASPETAEQMAEGLRALRPHLATDLRMGLRIEHALSPDTARILALIKSQQITLAMFSNRAEWARDLWEQDPAGFDALAAGLDHDAESLRLMLERLAADRSAVPRSLCALAEHFDTLGVRYGSVEDNTGEAREHHSMIGASLCMLPRSRRAAAAARAVSDPVVIAADDLLDRLRTQTLTPKELAGIDALVSGQAAISLAELALHLAESGVLPLPQAWALISERPAQLLRLTDRGRLDLGCRADLTIVNAQSLQVEATLSKGRLAFLSGGAAARFLDRRVMTAVAAE